MKFWHVPPDWEGQDCVIICGGTSITPEVLELARDSGMHSIVINSVYEHAPWAELLFFADVRWWDYQLEHKAAALADFRGRIVTVSRKAHGDHLIRLRRTTAPPHLAKNNDSAYVVRTSLTGALNICLHRKARRVVLLGVDNRDGDNKRAHFHEEYPPDWQRMISTWRAKQQEIEGAAKILAKAGIEVVNCSPITTLTCWPKADAMEALRPRG